MENKTPSYRLALIGYGHMGSALADRWMTSPLVAKIQICDPKEIHQQNQCSSRMFHVKQAENLDFSSCDLLVLAVKPQVMTPLLDSIMTHLPDGLPVLSIAAGKSLTYFASKLEDNRPLIRAMPNTPAAIGQGVTALCERNGSEDIKIMVQSLFALCGQVVWLTDETMMDAVTALAGSGPAYLYYIIESLANNAVRLGFSETEAIMLARQTVIGASALAAQKQDHSVSALRQAVTSKGGTTEAGLAVLMDGRLDQILLETLKAAEQRSKDLQSS